MRDKLERAFDRAIYVLGADHHGVRGWYKVVASMLGYEPSRVEVLLYQLVHLTRGGAATKMSKRRGDVVFLDELLDEIGVDAARWYLVNRGHDQAIEIDVDLARERSEKNPVYYVQYAHARIAGIVRNADSATCATLAHQPERGERELLKRLVEFPAVVAEATERRGPHAIPIYAVRVADDFHRFYHDCRVLGSEPSAVPARAVPRDAGSPRALPRSRRRRGPRAHVTGCGYDGCPMADASAPDRNLALELVRVTEAAALAAGRWVGRGDKNAADQAAVDAMRYMLDTVPMDGVVVIGEGEKDEAPMLFNGEEIGNGDPPAVDIAVDPLEGTRLTSVGQPNAIAVIALAERGTMFFPGAAVYMDKIACGAELADAIDITASPVENVRRAAEARGVEASAVTRGRPRPRAQPGADRHAARDRRQGEPDHGRRRRAGAGGGPARLARRSDDGHRRLTRGRHLGRGRQVSRRGDAGAPLATHRRGAPCARRRRLRPERVLTTDDLVAGDDVFVAATGVTDGALLRGRALHAGRSGHRLDRHAFALGHRPAHRGAARVREALADRRRALLLSA